MIMPRSAHPLGWRLSDLGNYLRWLGTWPNGRPLGFFQTGTLAFLGGKLGGLSRVYIIGFLIQTVNVFLIYSLLRRISSETVALIGALTFALYPADTTHTFLEISLGLRPSLTFLLIASHLYLSGYKILSYLVSLGSLLTYESAYVVFLAVPLLSLKWDKKLLREMIRHFIIWLGILIIVVAIRIDLGEERVLAAGSSVANIEVILWQSIQSLAIGPAVSLWMFAYGPGRTFLHWNRELTYVFLASLPLFFLLFHRINRSTQSETLIPDPDIAETPTRNTHTAYRSILDSPPTRLMIASLVMLSLAYAHSFTHFPPTTLYGRMTSVHMAAAFGGSIFFASLCYLCLSFARAHHMKFLAIAFLVSYLSLLVAYRFSIQLDFKQAWENQQWFWTSVIEKTPDLTDGTVIFVLDHDLPATRYIQTNSWADPIILSQIYQFPANYETLPRLFVVPFDWKDTIIREADQFKLEFLVPIWTPHWEILPDSKVILLEMENGELVRRYGSITINGNPLQLQSVHPNVYPTWKKGNLYPYLITQKE